ncbi:MAG: hypothetical protein ACK4YU_10400 [Paracoccus sp. (in: a-proteobacteria)]
MAAKKTDATNGSARPEGEDDPSVTRPVLRDGDQGKTKPPPGITALGFGAIGMGLSVPTATEGAESAPHAIPERALPESAAIFDRARQEADAMAAAPANKDTVVQGGSAPTADSPGAASGAGPVPEGQATLAGPSGDLPTDDDGFLDSLLGADPAWDTPPAEDPHDAEPALNDMWEDLLSDDYVLDMDMSYDLAITDTLDELLAGLDLSGALNRETGLGPMPFHTEAEGDPEIDDLLNEIIDSSERAISGVSDPMLALLDLVDTAAPVSDLFGAELVVEGALATLFGEDIAGGEAVGAGPTLGGLLGGLPDMISNEIE